MDVASRSLSALSVGARQSTHRLECLRCRQPFLAFFGEAARMRREEKSRQRRYVFAVREPGGGQARVEFKDAGSEPFEAVHGDLLAFLCTPERTVRGVTNLTTNRTFWATRGGLRNGW